MKKNIILFSIILLGVFSIALISCNDDPEETCGQDEICEAKEVVSCCSDDVCVYKYNGKEYAETEVDQLAIDLGCGAAAALKSTDQKSDLTEVVNRLKALTEKVRSQK